MTALADRARLRAARARLAEQEAIRRGMMRVPGQGPAGTGKIEEHVPHGLQEASLAQRRLAVYTKTGPDLSDPYTAQISNALGSILELPVGRNRSQREAELLRTAVRARHYDAACALIAPRLVTAEFSPAHRAMFAWWRGIGVDRPRPIVVCVNRGGGKALSLDEKIPTPAGWTTMGDVSVGDVVLGPDGSPVVVTHKSSVMRKPGFRVVFDDGAAVLASGDHLWTVLDRQTRYQMKREGAVLGSDWWGWSPAQRPGGNKGRTNRTGAATVTTEDLTRKLMDGRERNWAIPLGGIEGIDAADLPLDPWLLGFWLGDGRTDGAQLTVGAADVDAVKKLLEGVGHPASSVTADPRTGAFTVGLGWPLIGQTGLCRRGHQVAWTPAGKHFCVECRNGGPVLTVLARLRRAGVLGNKHIPGRYLRASRAQRVELVRGLMDSDGTAGKNGRTSFTSTSKPLMDGFVELCDSLGWPARVTSRPARLNGRDTSTAWLCTFRADATPFHLERKAARWSPPQFKPLRRVASIEPVGDIDCACIAVDHPSHLFLAGARMVPTHNTAVAQLIVVLSVMEHLRPYFLYVGRRQKKVAKNVAGIAELLMQPLVARAFPAVGSVYKTATGQQRGFTKDEFRTESRVSIEAVGLDQDIRGLRADEDRPGFIIGDDWESAADSEYILRKGEETWTDTILPARATNAATMLVQNRQSDQTTMARLLDGKTDMLADRQIVGPIPQVEDLTYVENDEYEAGWEWDGDGPEPPDLMRRKTRQWLVTGGRPTWPFRGLAESEADIAEFGLGSFLSESQHHEPDPEDSMFPSDNWSIVPRSEVPESGLICRAWDLAGGEADTSDFTVGVLMMLVGKKRLPLIIHVERFQFGVADVSDRVVELADADEDEWGQRYEVVIEDQPGTAGKLWRREWDDVLSHHRLHYEPPVKSKPRRARALAKRQQQKAVTLVKGPWNSAFSRELRLFTTIMEEHDDQVDAAAHAYNRLMVRAKRKRGRATTQASRQLPRQL